MPAYVILIRERTTDADELAAYAAKAREARSDHAITPIAFYGAQHVPEGPAPEGVAILQFPSLAEARAWYDSPAYQEAAKHRFAGAECRMIMVEGV